LASVINQMDNATRSDITRKKAIEAALVVLTKDGVGSLTFDALSKESGISRGGLMHQFRNKDGVISALLAHQRETFDQIAAEHLKGSGAKKKEKHLSALLAIHKASASQPMSVARAVLVALVENPQLVEELQATHQVNMQAVKEEASDADLSTLRYYAASGLAVNILLGLTKIPATTLDRLFDTLMDDERWGAMK